MPESATMANACSPRTELIHLRMGSIFAKPEVGVQQVGEAVVDIAVLGHVLGLAKQPVLPGRRRVGSAEDLLGPVQCLGDLDDLLYSPGWRRHWA